MNLLIFMYRALNSDKLRWKLRLYNLVFDDDPTILPCVMSGYLFLCIASRCLNGERQKAMDENDVKVKEMPHLNVHFSLHIT